jgi:hypothetical protein
MLRKIFQDKSGKIVIAQKPNLPIIVWAIARLLLFLPISSPLSDFLSLLAFGSLFTWAWLEIFSGVNLFRRILGCVVMALIFVFGL